MGDGGDVVRTGVGGPRLWSASQTTDDGRLMCLQRTCLRLHHLAHICSLRQTGELPSRHAHASPRAGKATPALPTATRAVHPTPTRPAVPPLHLRLQFYKWTAPFAGFLTAYVCSNDFLASLVVLGNGVDADGAHWQ